MGAPRSPVDELLKMPRAARSEAAEQLLASLEEDGDEDEADVHEAWAREIERRVEADEPGIAAEQVLAEGRARLKRA